MRSWMWMFLGTWLVASGGCNCLIDADKYRGGPSGDGGSSIDGADNIDGTAPPDGLIESDAGPIEPTSAREGEGSGTGAPPVVIVLRGTFEVGSTASVVRSGDDTELVDGSVVLATDRSMLAIPIRIPVYDDLDETETATLAIRVNGTLAANFEVGGLLEADLSGSVDTTTLRPLYSSITTSANVVFTGTSPAILRSTSDITVGNALRANGQTSGAAGAGGCSGGGIAQPGGCGTSGGTGGASGTTIGDGGAGGGHADNGNPGTGGADGGESSGNDMVTPLTEDGGNGGGGGGNGLAGTGAGGTGGGGGGVVALVAGGSVIIDAIIDASGGNGGHGTGTCSVNAGGEGGGGSGGAVLVTGMAASGSGSVDASGGAGATRNTCNAGGNGSTGRIRIDLASEDLPAITADPAPVRGPHWADDTLSIVRDSDFTATMYGEPGQTFAANLDGSNPQNVPINGSGVGSYHVTLEAGHNRICAIASPTNLTLPEAVRCMDVTYVP